MARPGVSTQWSAPAAAPMHRSSDLRLHRCARAALPSPRGALVATGSSRPDSSEAPRPHTNALPGCTGWRGPSI
eukprot:scaffold478_cov409-Prasinococcus_capsulatus_cf.AAC.13